MRVSGIQVLIGLLPAYLAGITMSFAGTPSFSLSSLSALQKATVAARSTSLSSIRRAVAGQPAAHRTLDLRPPEMPPASDDVPGSAPRHLMGSENKHAASLAEVAMSKPMSPAEAFARRVHQEGLPVARLWETRSALVSVGLNQKGKPGLWLIQKTH